MRAPHDPLDEIVAEETSAALLDLWHSQNLKAHIEAAIRRAILADRARRAERLTELMAWNETLIVLGDSLAECLNELYADHREVEAWRDARGWG